MPYIQQVHRKLLQMGGFPNSPGELNYAFTLLIIEYLRTNGANYQSYNDIVGALECCKLELYRRQVSDYETKKIEENGDVYPSG